MEDVKKMLDGIGSSKLLEVYLVHPARTFVLSWESPSVKWNTNVVIEEILEPDSIRELDLEKITQPKRHEELRPECDDQGNVSGRPEHDQCNVSRRLEPSNHIAANENDNLVDLDYETN
ncbi:hypothetical protein Fot_30443 [Forsythia ovata]|uniref:Uncharacterized protein n=1 Tax=Forsythia ovata TaxID=205694 RepID=A0ABD1TVJ8_9LAMI